MKQYSLFSRVTVGLPPSLQDGRMNAAFQEKILKANTLLHSAQMPFNQYDISQYIFILLYNKSICNDENY